MKLFHTIVSLLLSTPSTSPQPHTIFCLRSDLALSKRPSNLPRNAEPQYLDQVTPRRTLGEPSAPIPAPRAILSLPTLDQHRTAIRALPVLAELLAPNQTVHASAQPTRRLLQQGLRVRGALAMRSGQRSAQNFFALRLYQRTRRVPVLDRSEQVVQMSQAQCAFSLVEEDERFAQQREEDVNRDYGFDGGVVQTALNG